MTDPDPSLVPSEQVPAPNGDADTSAPTAPGAVRDKLGIDLAEMAALIGMSESGYRLWEKGTRRPGGPAFKLLALMDTQPRDMLSRLRELNSED